ncbi:AMP-dependent synthetase/ligase [Schaalia cardiffensis]|uniref:AMP-dependent synthetase/ligase n=1 Tax=Schaalia cardiffensis TaxID=181487 RepID=UPI0023F3BCDE|nr:AMP-dependent synthetase/ligase [Schaalia cardiffensis]
MKKLRDGSYTVKAKFTIDPADTATSLFAARATAHPRQIAVEERTPVGTTRPITAGELQRRIDDTARGLIGLGVRHGDTVAILSPTSFEWMLLDFAILSIGAVTVPIYESDSAAQITHILSDAKVTRVFTQSAQQAELVSSVIPNSLVCVSAIDTGAMREIASAAQRIDAQELERRKAAVRSEDLATIIYTSGTTGVPKGVALTHANFVGTCLSTRQLLGSVIDSPDTRILLFLPLAHVLARLVMHVILSGQGVIGFSPNIKNLLPDLKAFKPSVLLVVPRVLEKIYNAASAKAGKGLKKTIFSWSAKQAKAYARAQESRLGPSPFLRMRHHLADSLVLKKVRQIIGPNLRYVISGGAPLAADLSQFYSGMGLTLLQGYGLSETTGPLAVQSLDHHPSGYVGPVLPGNFVKIAKDGEILVKGVSVMRGYYNLPDETAQVMEHGWFHTGDLGSMDRKHGLQITGRKKELIVTAGGKNVSPEVLEEQLITHPLLASVIVVGDARPYIGALFTLDHDMLGSWLTNHGLPVVDPAAAAKLPEIQASLERAVAKANKAVSRAESIRRFRIIDTAFTVENGYLTPSLKLKRSAVLRDFAHEVDALYAEGENSRKKNS